MSSIFISYRRDDSAPYAGRLYDRLSAHFGAAQVFMDIDQIEPGEDFVEVIERKVGACATAVVLIGPRWLGAVDAQGYRRLDDAADFVRLEIAAALQREVRVVPVLVGGAAMPRAEQLPAPIASLARRNAVELSDSRFHRDVDRLIVALGKPMAQATAPTRLPVALASPLQAIVGVALLAAAGVAAWMFLGARTAAPPQAAVNAPPAMAPLAPVSSAVFSFGRKPGLDTTALKAQQRDVARRAAHTGGPEAQFRFAVDNECVDPTDSQEARNWYRLAAAQGHAGARTALARLDAPGSDDPKQHDARALRRKMDCLAALQAMTADVLDTMHRQASGAIRSIKTD